MIGSGTAKDSKAAFPVTSEQSAASATYVQNDVKLNNANRLTYIQLSKATTGDYALTTDYATHTFGRLG